MKITLLDDSIAQQLRNKTVFNYPVEKIWNPDGVSLKKRLKADPLFRAKVEQVLTPANLRQYVVPADLKAPARCIDGRIMKDWDKSKKLQKRTLGPKIAGGTSHAALAHRIVDVDKIKNNLDFIDDITHVIELFKTLGLGVGGHIDDHQQGSNTGCGAVDNINLILERLQRPEPQEQIRGLARMILGEAYDARHTANEMIGRMLLLDALKPRYMPKENNDPTGEFLYKRVVVDTMRRAADQKREVVPELVGVHNEVAIMLNFVANTTIDTDRFGHDSDNEIQVFGWDVWEMYQEAEQLYPSDMHESLDEQEQKVIKRINYVTTRTFLGVATLMVLSDGSLRVIKLEDE